MALEGLAAPMLTLFADDGSLDLGRNARFARGLTDAHVDHLFVLGSNGEFPSVLPKERGPLIDIVVESASGSADVWAGCGAPSTAQAVAFAEEAENLGVAALVAVPPYYLHPSMTAVDHYYRALRQATSIPLLAYNNPSLVGYALPPSLMHALAREKVIVGLKDSGGSLESVLGYLNGAPDGFTVLPGDPPLASAAIERGARGAVMGVSNVLPRLCAELVHVACQGDRTRASELQSLVDRLVGVAKLGPNPSTLKFLAAELRGSEVGYRAPYEPLTEVERAAVLAGLEPLRPLFAPFVAP